MAHTTIEQFATELKLPAGALLEQLAKVEWTSRTPVTGDLDLVVAREVEVTSGSAPMRPEAG